MLVAENRPRSLHWYHAGPLLFGDWGTSRLYVLGLAFYYTAHASPMYLTAMSLIMIACAWAYTVICRCFPDGGGVYAAARRISPTLAVVGATLLLCDYIVTAALSAVEAFHYIGVDRRWTLALCAVTVVLLGVINWLGARSAGRLALFIAIAALGVSSFLAVLCLPHVGEGLATATTGHDPAEPWWSKWESLVRIVLALAGLEAVANMTGLMKQPVARTAKRTIWPVCVEVVALNLIFGLALNALPGLKEQVTPDYVTFEVQQGLAPDQIPEEVKEYRDTAMRKLAEHAGTEAFGERFGHALKVSAGVVFGLLLLSAVNTAIMALVSVLFSMAQDRELPRVFAKLNYSGVPWVGLIVACLAPLGLLAFEADVKALGELYAIGVVGAISINFLCCAYNRELPIKRWERNTLWVLGSVMTLVEITIIIAKPNATMFAGALIALVLGLRFAVKMTARRTPPPLERPEQGWLAEVKADLEARDPRKLDARKPRIMLAARGRDQAEYAVDLARKRGAVLFVIYVRTLRVLDAGPSALPRIENDPQAQEGLGIVSVLARRAGVPVVPIYVTSSDIASEILDYTVTFGCDTLIMGKSRRSVFARRVEGDVVSEVTRHLPPEVTLVTRAARTDMGPEPEVEARAGDGGAAPADAPGGAANAPGASTTPAPPPEQGNGGDAGPRPPG